MMSFRAIWVWFMCLLGGGVAQQIMGEGTFYGHGGAGKNGACMLNTGFNGVSTTVALNPVHYAGGQACGKCIKAWGSGEGSGMTPLKGPIYATVDNVCPECKSGDVDFGMGGDGRWKIQWQFVGCEEARFGGSPHYLRSRHRA